MQEESLQADPKHPIVRIGDTVHRPVNFWSPAVHDLLKYLESVGFKYAPRYLGQDEDGREVLSYIDGESGASGWSKITDDVGLRSFAKLLREYHEAVSGYTPSPELEWSDGKKGLKAGQVICHGDFGPWNIVWRGTEPIGVVDWDMAHPAAREHDVLYALEYSAPFRDDETAIEWHHFKSIPNRKQRVRIFMEAYGKPAIDGVAQKVAAMQREVKAHEAYLAERGVQPQVDWVADGDLEKVESRAKWTDSNARLFD